MTENEKTGLSTRERAKIAALELLLAGTCPTSDSVRKQMGDTGSKSTINPALKEFWEKDLPKKLKNLLFIPELPKEVSAKFMEFWATAIETTTGAAEQIKAQALADLEVATQAQTALQEQLTGLNAEIVQYQKNQQEEATLKQALAEKLFAAEAVNGSLSAQIEGIRAEAEKLVAVANQRADIAEAQSQQEVQRAKATEARLIAQMAEQQTVGKRQDEANAERIGFLTSGNQEKDRRIKDLSADLETANQGLRADLLSIQFALSQKTGRNNRLGTRLRERIKSRSKKT